LKRIVEANPRYTTEQFAERLNVGTSSIKRAFERINKVRIRDEVVPYDLTEFQKLPRFNNSIIYFYIHLSDLKDFTSLFLFYHNAFENKQKYNELTSENISTNCSVKRNNHIDLQGFMCAMVKSK
jgi:hypothetical protein